MAGLAAKRENSKAAEQAFGNMARELELFAGAKASWGQPAQVGVERIGDCSSSWRGWGGGVGSQASMRHIWWAPVCGIWLNKPTLRWVFVEPFCQVGEVKPMPTFSVGLALL